MISTPERIPTFIRARTPEELRALFFPVNILTAEIHTFQIMQDSKTGDYLAWFYALGEHISKIDELNNKFLIKRGVKK